MYKKKSQQTFNSFYPLHSFSACSHSKHTLTGRRTLSDRQLATHQQAGSYTQTDRQAANTLADRRPNTLAGMDMDTQLIRLPEIKDSLGYK